MALEQSDPGSTGTCLVEACPLVSLAKTSKMSYKKEFRFRNGKRLTWGFKDKEAKNGARILVVKDCPSHVGPCGCHAHLCSCVCVCACARVCVCMHLCTPTIRPKGTSVCIRKRCPLGRSSLWAHCLVSRPPAVRPPRPHCFSGGEETIS